jgi:hypothetical protein
MGIKPGDAVIKFDEGFHEYGIRVMVHFEICPGISCITYGINGKGMSGYPISYTNFYRCSKDVKDIV